MKCGLKARTDTVYLKSLLYRSAHERNVRAALRGVVPPVTPRDGGQDPLEVWNPKR